MPGPTNPLLGHSQRVSGLTACDLAAVSGVLEASWRSRCVVTRRSGTPVADEWGAATYPASAREYACHVGPLRGPRDAVAGGQPQGQADTAILLPLGAEVGPRDTIVANGQTYEIVATDAGRSDALAVRCECRKVGPQ